MPPLVSVFFFFNDTATTEIYTLSLHDALPISVGGGVGEADADSVARVVEAGDGSGLLVGDDRARGDCVIRVDVLPGDRKSTRLNSSHGYISYAVFCLKKKKKRQHNKLQSASGS